MLSLERRVCLLGLVLAVGLMLLLDNRGPHGSAGVQASPKGGGRGGGGGSRGGGGGRSWFSRGSSSSKSSSGSYSGSKTKSRLTKAALVGAGAYGGYKLGKLRSKFSHKRFVPYSSSSNVNLDFDFDDWNEWREADGFLCRTTADCSWVDERLYCQDYEFDFNPSALWFGGSGAVRLRGECACLSGLTWDEDDLECSEGSFWLSGGGIVLIITGVCVLITILILILC